MDDCDRCKLPKNHKLDNHVLSNMPGPIPILYLEQVVSVADPGCLSRIPDPDFYPSRIPDPKTATKERGEKNLMSYVFI
jgi:hypothetical protein